MKVLVACEYSGTVRDAFIAQGHDAVSCDLLPSDKPLNGPHYEGSVTDILYDQHWDLLIGHPPCTYLTNSGVSWLHKRPERWQQLDDGAAFFKLLWNAPVDKICLENPIMHKYALERIGAGKQNQVIQPWMFGHMEKKGTGLWLKNLPLLKPTSNLLEETNKLPKNIQQRIHMLPPTADRWKLRSTTFQGIADAMAQQWGSI